MLKVALYQSQVQPGNLEFQLNTLLSVLDESKRDNCDLVIFPELFLTGYYQKSPSLAQLAESIERENIIDKIQQKAVNLDIAVALGFPEKATDCIYNSCIFLSKSHRKIYRKAHLWEEFERDNFSRGEELPFVFQYRGVNISMMICYDVEFPEFVRVAKLRGAELLICCTANPAP